MEKLIVHDVSSSAAGVNTASLQWSHTVGAGNDRMLVVGITMEDDSTADMNVESVRFGNTDLLYVSNSSVIAGSGGSFCKAMLFYLPNPASGSYMISIKTVGLCSGISAGATSLENVYQGVPEAVATNAFSEAPADNLTAYISTFSKNAWVVDAACNSSCSANLSASASGMTERWKSDAARMYKGAGGTKEMAEAGRNAISWSSQAGGHMAISCAAFSPAAKNASVTIAYNFNSTQQTFGVSRLERILLQQSLQPVKIDVSKATGMEGVIVRAAANASIKKEGFKISKDGSSYIVEAADESGAMYGLLELGEKIQMHGLNGAEAVQVEARFPFRAIKHNTPWSSYRNDIAQDQHFDTMRDIAYWESFLDMMAENRFNTLTIWTQHPFPYMIRPKNFPKATPFTEEELNVWRYLYRNIFRMARERGIEVFLINWNIFVSEAFRNNYDIDAHTDAMGYFGDAYTTPQIEQYTRECVTQVLNEYPDLTGFGFTLGEFMGKMTAEEREKWALRTIIEGMKAADRPAKLIYRMPLSADTGSGGSTSKAVEVMTRNAMESLTGLVSPIETETKFNWSHAYSSTKLIQVHGGGISTTFWEPAPSKYRMDWMIRNEDFFTLRWGQPDFIRSHIKANGQPYVGGYYVGSECYYPALNYFDIQKTDDNRTNFAFQRQWLLYMTWGRLLYNSDTTDRTFELAFDSRYGAGIGNKLLKAYKLASDFPKLFGSFVYFTWDFTIYAEGFLCPVMAGGYDDGKSPFLSLLELMDHKVLDNDYISIKDYVSYITENRSIPAGKITPLQLADTLDQNAEQALKYLNDLTSSNPALQDEIGDIQAWSCLSRYFADKLRAGVSLQNYMVAKDLVYKDNAVSYIKAAKTHWESLISVTKPRYRPARLIHIKDDFSWESFLPEVERDIAAAQDCKPF